MAMGEQFVSYLADACNVGIDPAATQPFSHLAGTYNFGIDPALLSNVYLVGCHGEDSECGGNGDEDEGGRDNDIPTPPFFRGDHPSGSADQGNGQIRSGTNGAKVKVKSSTSSTGPSAAGGMGGSVGRPVIFPDGLAATFNHACLTWKVSDRVCGHPSCLGRVFKQKRSLLRHLLTHVAARPYVCRVTGCDMAFKHKWLLYRHSCVHQTRMGHKCPVEGCTITCSTVYNLQSHKLIHSPTKKFLCNFENCGRTFTTARNLRLHQPTDTGDKQFICKFQDCGMSYYRPYHLRRHHDANHAIKPPKPRKPRTTERSAAGTSRRGREGPAPKPYRESYVTHGIAVLEMNNAEGIGGALLSRPRRAAAIRTNQSLLNNSGDDGDEGDEFDPDTDAMEDNDADG